MSKIEYHLANHNETELDECANLMCQSEPWITLKFDIEKCNLAVRGDYKEVYVATINSEFAGFVVLQNYGVLRGYIQTICVEAKHRNKGIGTALIQFSEDMLFKKFPNIFMCVTSFNYRAQKLYYSLGYEKIGVLTNHIINGADEYILRKQQCAIANFVAK